VRYLRKPAWLFWLAALPLLGWALHKAPWRESAAVLLGLRPEALLILACVNTGLLFLFGGRWWLILRALGQRVPYLALIGYRLAGFGVSYFTPGPQFGGEPLQAFLLQRRENLPTATAFASVTLDRLLELLANFTFLLLGMLMILSGGLFSSAIRWQALALACGLFSLPVGYLLALRAGRRPLAGPLQRLASRRPGEATLAKLQNSLAAAEAQAGSLCREQPRVIWQALAVSLVVWGLMVGEYWLMLHLLGVRLPLPQVVAALTAARLAILLPMPGGLGALEASQVLALSALGVNPAYGASLGLLIRARDVLIGGLGLGLGSLLSPQWIEEVKI
jgi:uncharacterized protein (TIRG00374 family)